MKQLNKYPDTALFRFIVAERYSVAGFVISLVTVLVLSFTVLADAIYFEDPRHQDVELQAWMTPRYVALSYDLPRSLIREVFQIERNGEGPKRLDRIALRLGVSLQELTTIVRSSAATYRGQHSD